MDNLDELKNSLREAVATNNVREIYEIISNPGIISMNPNHFDSFIENEASETKNTLRALKQLINDRQAAEAEAEASLRSLQETREQFGHMLASTFPNNLQGNEEFNIYLVNQCADDNERMDELRRLRTEALMRTEALNTMSGGSYKKHNSRRKSKRRRSKRGKSKRRRSKRQKSKRSKRYY